MRFASVAILFLVAFGLAFAAEDLALDEPAEKLPAVWLDELDVKLSECGWERTRSRKSVGGQRGLASARSAAAQKPGCGCLGIPNPFASALSASQLAGPVLPMAVVLAPHVVRLARRRRRHSPKRS